MKDKKRQNISLSIKKGTLDMIIMVTSPIAALDFVIVPSVSQMIIGEYKTLHEYLGLPPNMNELEIGIGGAYWGLTMLYSILLRKKFVGEKSWI